MELTSDRDWLWSKVVEAYRARLTIGAAVFVAMVTLTGYGLVNKLPGVLLAATGFPTLLFTLDFFILRRFVIPFLYVVMTNDDELNSAERVGFLFLSFATLNPRLSFILAMEPGLERQQEFAKYLERRSVRIKVTLALIGTIGEFILFVYIAGLP